MAEQRSDRTIRCKMEHTLALVTVLDELSSLDQLEAKNYWQ